MIPVNEYSVEVEEKKIRLLLVEDEKKLARLIERQLLKTGYSVELAFDGEEAERMMHSKQYEVIVLDLNLPKRSGLEVLERFRKAAYATPVLILTAKNTAEDRVKGLSLGADDYLGKPFDSGELIARLNAILRRSGANRTSIVQVADLTIDLVKRRVQRNGKKIDLTQKEYELLEFFIQNKNQIITRKRLAEAVWGYTFDTGTNIVDVYIGYLRESIDKGFKKKLLQTVRGEGFVLVDD
jgi:two-component system copper resistance phosphate regulon response regulator CusR